MTDDLLIKLAEEKIALLMPPQARAVLWIAGAVLALLVLVFLYWLLFLRPAQNPQEASTVKGQTVVAHHEAKGAKEAVAIVSNNAAGETHTHEITRDHYVTITRQPGANDAVGDPLWSAFVRSVCMRDSAANDPQCVGLHRSDPR